MKKSRLTKVLSLMLTAAMLVPAAGCKKEQALTDGNITLKWIFPGPGEQKDSQKVWAEFNKRIKEFPGLENVDVDIECINTSDYKQRVLLMQTGDEKYDIVSTYSLNFANEIDNKALMPLDDLMTSENVDFIKELPDWIIDMGQKNGTTYAVISYQAMTRSDPGIVMPTELFDKYVDKDKLEKTFYNTKFYDEDNWQAVGDILQKMKDNGDLGLGYLNAGAIEPALNGYDYVGGNIVSGGFYTKLDDPEGQMYYIAELPEYKTAVKYLSDWYKKGFIRQDILSVDTNTDKKGTGGYTIFQGGVDGFGAQERSFKKQYGEDFTAVRSRKYNYVLPTAAGGGLAISAGCEHPQEAMRVIDVLSSGKGKELYNLMLYGIEGVQYDKVSDGVIKLKDGAGTSSSDSYGQYHWVVGNSKLSYELESEVGQKQYTYEVANEGPDTVVSNFMGFIPDIKSVITEITRINSLYDEYSKTLAKGAASDADALYNEYMEKLQTAGIEKVRECVQKQAKEFLAAKNK